MLIGDTDCVSAPLMQSSLTEKNDFLISRKRVYQSACIREVMRNRKQRAHLSAFNVK